MIDKNLIFAICFSLVADDIFGVVVGFDLCAPLGDLIYLIML